MRAITSAASAICGTHLGETKDVASIDGTPASASASISATFTSVGTTPFSFCSPSRGPTSTRRTRFGKRDGAAMDQYPFERSTTPVTCMPRSSARSFAATCAAASATSVTADTCGVIVIPE